MGYDNNSNYTKAIAERLEKIMTIAGLERAGFSEFTQISMSHIYALLNGRRKITGETADKIAIGFRLHGWQILSLDFEIPELIRKSPALNKFYIEHKDVPEYFKETIYGRKDAYFFEHVVLPSGLFDQPVYVWEIKNACTALGKKFSSKQISQMADYLAVTNKLKKEKRMLKKKNGELGIREVPVYYLEKPRTDPEND